MKRRSGVCVNLQYLWIVKNVLGSWYVVRGAVNSKEARAKSVELAEKRTEVCANLRNLWILKMCLVLGAWFHAKE
jgi:hypothetical protein